MVEILLIPIKLVHAALTIAQLIEFLRENPEIDWALAILLIAGAFAAMLIRRVRRDEPPFLSIRK